MATESEKQLEGMLAEFEKNHAKEGKNLRALLGNTPELKQGMVEAIDKGSLAKIEPLSAKNRAAGAVGVYRANDKVIELPLDFLEAADKTLSAANIIRITAGHEIEHAIHRDDIKKTTDQLEKDLLTIANGPSPHDYTSALKDFNTRSRDREARDEIAGLNVLAAHVKRENPNVTQEALYRKLYRASRDVQSYFDVKGQAPNESYEPKAGITFNDKFQVEATKKNVEAFGKQFYDARGYPANYLGKVIDAIGSIENRLHGKDAKPPEVKINLKELGIQGQVTLPSNVKDSSPRLGAPEVAAAKAASPTRSPLAPDPLLSELEQAGGDPTKLTEALAKFSNSEYAQDALAKAGTVLDQQANDLAKQTKENEVAIKARGIR